MPFLKLAWPFKSAAKAPEPPALTVTEGILGYHHYHLRLGTSGKALCGASVMASYTRLSDWGKPFGEHFPKRPTWCKTCNSLKDDAVRMKP